MVLAEAAACTASRPSPPPRTKTRKRRESALGSARRVHLHVNESRAASRFSFSNRLSVTISAVSNRAPSLLPSHATGLTTLLERIIAVDAYACSRYSRVTYSPIGPAYARRISASGREARNNCYACPRGKTYPKNAVILYKTKTDTPIIHVIFKRKECNIALVQYIYIQTKNMEAPLV